MPGEQPLFPDSIETQASIRESLRRMSEIGSDLNFTIALSRQAISSSKQLLAQMGNALWHK
jgi:hypothetical protein